MAMAQGKEIGDAGEMMRAATSLPRRPLLLCALLSIAASLAAQTPDTAALRGTVMGPDKKPLAGATVTIEDAQRHVLRTLQTNAEGGFAAEDLPVGRAIEVTASY